MKLEGAIFDMDGTLGNTLPVCLAAFRRALEEFMGRRYADEEIRALFGPTEEGVFQRLIPDNWQACMQIYLQAYEKAHHQYAVIFPGMETALRLLQQRSVRLAIVTGKGAQSAAISLKHLGLEDYFDELETGSADGAVKPRLIRKVLTRWDAPPHEVAYIGDVPSDIDAASEAGVIPVGAAWAATSKAEGLAAREPRFIFSTIDSFINWIETQVEFNGG